MQESNQAPKPFGLTEEQQAQILKQLTKAAEEALTDVKIVSSSIEVGESRPND